MSSCTHDLFSSDALLPNSRLIFSFFFFFSCSAFNLCPHVASSLVPPSCWSPFIVWSLYCLKMKFSPVVSLSFFLTLPWRGISVDRWSSNLCLYPPLLKRARTACLVPIGTWARFPGLPSARPAPLQERTRPNRPWSLPASSSRFSGSFLSSNSDPFHLSSFPSSWVLICRQLVLPESSSSSIGNLLRKSGRPLPTALGDSCSSNKHSPRNRN